MEIKKINKVLAERNKPIDNDFRYKNDSSYPKYGIRDVREIECTFEIVKE